MRLSLACTLALLLVTGCITPAVPPDGGVDGTDAGIETDAGVQDAGFEVDAGTFEDAGTDGGTMLPASGFGVISGACGMLDDELTSAEPDFFVNRIDFGTDPYDDGDFDLLTAGGQEIINDGNAGGSSILSEVFSYELLSRCEGAVLLKTETEVQYTNSQGKITDLLVEIDGLKVGVSVTRAVAFPFENPYTVEQAQEILERKLQDILASSARVAPADKWVKQVLYVIAYGEGHATSLEAAYDQIDPSLKADTIVMVTVSDGDDDFIY